MLAGTWIVVRTRTRQERTAAEWIGSRGYTTFLPLCIVQKNPVPLFPGYLFVQIFTAWRELLQLRGVVNVLRACDGSPSAVREDVIGRIRRWGTVDLRAVHMRLAAGDNVCVLHGPWTGLVGRVDCRRGHERVRVLLALLGRMVPVELEETALERVA